MRRTTTSAAASAPPYATRADPKVRGVLNVERSTGRPITLHPVPPDGRVPLAGVAAGAGSIATRVVLMTRRRRSETPARLFS
jgi:hypothetical protein